MEQQQPSDLALESADRTIDTDTDAKAGRMLTLAELTQDDNADAGGCVAPPPRDRRAELLQELHSVQVDALLLRDGRHREHERQLIDQHIQSTIVGRLGGAFSRAAIGSAGISALSIADNNQSNATVPYFSADKMLADSYFWPMFSLALLVVFL